MQKNTLFDRHFPRTKNSGQDVRKSPEPARCSLSDLCADFHTIAEGEHHPAVRIDRCVIHKPMEQLLVEIHRQFFRLAKSREEGAENVILNFLPFPLFFQVVHPAFQSGVPAGIPVILFAVVVLVKFPGGILINQLLDQPRCHLHLIADCLHLRIDVPWLVCSHIRLPSDSPHEDTLAFGYILPTAGRIRDLHPLETCAARRT